MKKVDKKVSWDTVITPNSSTKLRDISEIVQKDYGDRIKILQDQIKDDTRISLCLPFIKNLIKKKAKIIILSHLGRPKGIKDPKLSLMPIYKYLKKSLQTNIFFFMGNFDDAIKVKDGTPTVLSCPSSSLKHIRETSSALVPLLTAISC